jgi:hypothetical protein
MKLKIKELRDWANNAVQNNLISLQVDAANMSKKDLQKLYETYNPPTAVEQSVGQASNIVPTDSNTQTLPEPTDPIVIPSIDSEEWTPFILSRLREKEQFTDENGTVFPTSDGLRRLFELYIGPIINLDVDVKQTPEPSNERRATVVVKILYRKNNTLHSISDASDCYAGNNTYPYSNYPVATSVTMAESRCLRKGLRLTKIISADEARLPDKEVSEAFMASNEKITGNQKNAINNLCHKLNINTEKFLLSVEELKSNTLDNMSYEQGSLALKEIMAYNKGKIIPENLLNDDNATN